MTRNKALSLLYNILLALHFIIWVLDVPLSQIQLIIFSQRYITLFHISIIEIIIITTILYITCFRVKIKAFFFYGGAVFISLFFVWLIGLIINYDVALYWKIYYVLFWMLPMLVCTLVNQNKFNIDPLINLILCIIVIHAIFILIQHFTNNLIWPYIVDNEGNNLFFISSGYYNLNQYMVRCPGLCNSGLQAGILLIFGLMLLQYKNNLKTNMKIAISILFFVSILYTGTRNIYAQLLFIIGIITIIKNKRISLKTKRFIVVLLTIFAVFVYIILLDNIGGGDSTRNILTDTASVGARLRIWSSVISQISSAGFLKFLFGQGLWSSAGYNAVSVIDNMYLNWIVGIGLIGAISYIYFLIMQSRSMLSNYNIRSKIFGAFVLSCFVYGVANVMSNQVMTLIIIAITVNNNWTQNSLLFKEV